ncbi:MAG: hypothetical protein AAF561_02260 [Planctomycetota bacterium]
MTEQSGKGFFGWLGRQIGHVGKAIKTDVEVVAKKTQVDESVDADHPGLVFRRTTTDEVRHAPREGAERKEPS